MLKKKQLKVKSATIQKKSKVLKGSKKRQKGKFSDKEFGLKLEAYVAAMKERPDSFTLSVYATYPPDTSPMECGTTPTPGTCGGHDTGDTNVMVVCN